MYKVICLMVSFLKTVLNQRWLSILYIGIEKELKFTVDLDHLGPVSQVKEFERYRDHLGTITFNLDGRIWTPNYADTVYTRDGKAYYRLDSNDGRTIHRHALIAAESDYWSDFLKSAENFIMDSAAYEHGRLDCNEFYYNYTQAQVKKFLELVNDPPSELLPGLFHDEWEEQMMKAIARWKKLNVIQEMDDDSFYTYEQECK